MLKVMKSHYFVYFLPWCPGRPCSGCKPFAVLFCPAWSTGAWPSMCWLQPSGSCRSCCGPEDLGLVVCRGCWTPEESLCKWTLAQSSRKARRPAPGAHPPSRPSSGMAGTRSPLLPLHFSRALPCAAAWRRLQLLLTETTKRRSRWSQPCWLPELILQNKQD